MRIVEQIGSDIQQLSRCIFWRVKIMVINSKGETFRWATVISRNNIMETNGVIICNISVNKYNI